MGDQAHGSSSKRPRGDSDELPESKRFRDSDLEILEHEGYAVDGGDCLADVINSLEGEIASPATAEEANVCPQPELGYLLEASDDDLGLPPLDVGSSSSDGGVVVDEEPGYGHVIWGLENEFTNSPGPYEGLAFGILTEFDDGVIFNDGLFDFSDVICGPLESGWSVGPV